MTLPDYEAQETQAALLLFSVTVAIFFFLSVSSRHPFSLVSRELYNGIRQQSNLLTGEEKEMRQEEGRAIISSSIEEVLLITSLHLK